MQVKNIMSTKVATVVMDTPLEKIAEIFETAHFHHLLVVDNGMLVGVISDRDLLRNLSPFIGTMSESTRDLGTLKKHAHQVMSRNPISVSPSHTLPEAIQLILDHNISCLPVIDGADLVGVITWKDILQSVVHTL